jgi:hypothetical protein
MGVGVVGGVMVGAMIREGGGGAVDGVFPAVSEALEAVEGGREVGGVVVG